MELINAHKFKTQCLRCGLNLSAEFHLIFKDEGDYYCLSCAVILSHEDPFEKQVENERNKREEG